MNQQSKKPDGDDGIPGEVTKLFQSCEKTLVEFAAKFHLELRPYENYDQPGDACAWNFYGHFWGRSICIQVSTFPELARLGRFQIWVYTDQQEIYGPHRSPPDDYLAITDGSSDSEQLMVTLELAAIHATEFAGRLPWWPAREPALA